MADLVAILRGLQPTEALATLNALTEIGKIILPAANVTCPASGAAGSSNIYFTAALFGMPQDAGTQRDPAGTTFLIKGAFQGHSNVPVKIDAPTSDLTA